MAKGIKRTITLTRVFASEISVIDGKVLTEPRPDFTLPGTPDNAKILKHLAKENPGKQFVITETVAELNRMVISLEDFIKYAKVLEPPKA